MPDPVTALIVGGTSLASSAVGSKGQRKVLVSFNMMLAKLVSLKQGLLVKKCVGYCSRMLLLVALLYKRRWLL
jgi:hypothetical protein